MLSGTDGAAIVLWKGQAAKAGLRLRKHGHCIDLERDQKVLRIRSSHTIYVPHMIESFDYYFNSVEPVSENGKSLVDMSGPKHHRLVGFSDIPFLFSSHTEPYSTTQEYLDFADLKPGGIVFDIGAYSGVTSIIFARLVGPTGHVYAFEADQTNYECASANLQAAADALGIHNITLIHKAVWSHNNGLMFSNEGSMGSSAVAITGGGRGEETRVDSVTIETFCQQKEISHVDFVKLDIEGGETEVLKHSGATLRLLKPRLIIEPHRVGGKLNTQQCVQLLESHGFNVHVRDKTPGSEALIEAS